MGRRCGAVPPGGREHRYRQGIAVIEPSRITFEVACSVEHAFAVWTAGIGTWWPWDHTVTAIEGLAIVLEPGLGGRIFEHTLDGVEHDWGVVTAWDPPPRLAYLWHLRQDRLDATEVEIRFVDKGVAGTRVEIEHTGRDRLGSAGAERRQRNSAGWDTLLPHYRAAIE
ncbi:MAG: SRPBCC domain-containing protein [Cellulomonas sp.]